MKPFSELTRLGRIRRLRQVALKTLENYDLDVLWVRFFVIETNTMFKVCTRAGHNYVLRIYTEEDTTIKENQVEVYWLSRLNAETELRVSTPVSRRDGDYISQVRAPGVPDEKRCVLYEWIPGRTLDNFLSPQTYFELGQAMAQMHDHAASLNPLPADRIPKAWDQIFYYPDEPIVYQDPANAHWFTPERLEMMNEVIARADAIFKRLFRDREHAILIHGDLHYWNVHFHRGQLYLLDFEDVTLGFPIQDIAISFYYGRDRADYQALRTAFQAGYSTVRDWPDEPEVVIQTLMAARGVGFMNYVACSESEPEGYLAQISKRLQHYLTAYPSVSG